jgi:hypothetical protein
MDLRLSLVTGDLEFVNGECPVTKTRIEVVAQRLYIRLRTFYGEWFLTDEYGVPYLERILGQKTNKNSVDAIFQEQIHEENGVVAITYFRSNFNNATREYSCQFTVRVDSGEETQLITFNEGGIWQV